MSFSFTAIGTAAEVRAQLAEVSTDNVLGARLAETLVEQLAPELLPADNPDVGYEYRYVVKAYGHSGGSSALHLKADIEAHWTPKVATDAAVVAAEITDHRADVLAAIDTYERDLGFAAPETHADRLRQLRSQVAGIFEPAPDDDEDDTDDDED